MKLAVHIHLPRYGEEQLANLRAELGHEIELTSGPEPPSPTEYDILISGRPTRALVSSSPRLRALIIPWAGIPESTRGLMLEFPQIAVHNLHHNALPVAEHMLALLLAAAKFLIPMDWSLRAHDWRPRHCPNPSILLEGRRVLILGYGAIGRRMGLLCRALGMEVMAVRRHVDAAASADPDPVGIFSLDALDDLLPAADILLICLPHTPETSGLIGARELGLLPPQAVLVNVGRGPIVEEAALYHALQQGTLYAAGLDVWYNYPEDEASRAATAPSAYPFHELDNVVMSPHRAGGSTESESLRIAHLAEVLSAAASGEPIPNRVDLRAGY